MDVLRGGVQFLTGIAQWSRDQWGQLPHSKRTEPLMPVNLIAPCTTNPVSISGAITDGVIRLAKTPAGSFGAPTITHYSGDPSSHTAIGIGTLGSHQLESHMPPLPLEPLALTKLTPHAGSAGPHGPFSHYLSFTESCIRVNVAIPHSLQVHNTSGITLLVLTTQPALLRTPTALLCMEESDCQQGSHQLPYYRSSQN